MVHDCRVFNEVLAERPRHCVDREIILGRPQPPGDEHRVRATQRQTQRVLDALRVVPDGLLEEDIDAERRQLTGDVGGVRIGDLAE